MVMMEVIVVMVFVGSGGCEDGGGDDDEDSHRSYEDHDDCDGGDGGEGSSDGYHDDEKAPLSFSLSSYMNIQELLLGLLQCMLCFIHWCTD